MKTAVTAREIIPTIQCLLLNMKKLATALAEAKIIMK